MIDLRLLIENGVHFGHQTERWSPKMEPYIWGLKNGIHLIDVSKTASQLEKAAKFLESVAAAGRTIVLVGTKKAAQGSIERVGSMLGLPHIVHRWVGGTFTNHRQVRKAVANLLTYEDILSKSEDSHYTKKEINLLRKRADRLARIVGGIRNLTWPVGAVVVVDVKKENVVVKEAYASGIPVVGLVDTNSDPSHVDYIIPANDDSPRSVSLLIDYLADAIKRGQQVVAERPKKNAIEEVSEEVSVELEATQDEVEDEKQHVVKLKTKKKVDLDDGEIPKAKVSKPKAKNSVKKSKEEVTEPKEATLKSKEKLKNTEEASQTRTRTPKKDAADQSDQ